MTKHTDSVVNLSNVQLHFIFPNATLKETCTVITKLQLAIYNHQENFQQKQLLTFSFA